MFSKPNEIYKAKDIFGDGDKKEFTEVADKLFESLTLISCCTSSSFDSYEKTRGVWDMIIAPIELGYIRDLQKDLKKDFLTDQNKLDKKIDIDSSTVTKIYFFVCVQTSNRLPTDELAIEK